MLKGRRPGLSETFQILLKTWRIKMVREYRFHPTRRWSFDFADPETKVAVEIDGGAFIGGRHTRGSGFVKDQEKLNTATSMGWRVFRYSTIAAMNEFKSHRDALDAEDSREE